MAINMNIIFLKNFRGWGWLAMYGPPIVIYRLVKYYDYFYEETGKIKYSFKNI